MFFRTRDELKQAYAQALRAVGKSVSIDVPVGDRGSVDILTDTEIIFCVLELTEQSATAVRSQLDFYGRFSPSWEKVVVVQQISGLEAAAMLANSGIKVIDVSQTLSSSFSSDFPAQSKAIQLLPQADRTSPAVLPETIYRYPKLDSVAGGDGLRAVIATFAFVFLLSIAIALIQS